MLTAGRGDMGVKAQHNERRRWSAFAIRTTDLLLSAVLLVVTAPLVILASGFISLTSPGEPVIRQRRTGRGGCSFDLFKIRTMVPDAERDGPVLAARRDHRLLPGASTIRALHIDELPQLLNVLRGDMSLVGPRPERPVFVEVLTDALSDYPRRHDLRPGLTGVAQVEGGYHMAAQEKLTHDLVWCRRPTLMRYVWVLVLTPFAILRDLSEARQAEIECDHDLPLAAARGPKDPAVASLS